MKVVAFEIKRAFKSFEFKLSIIVGLIIALFDVVLFYKKFLKVPKVVLQAWLGTDYQLPYGALFCLLIPLLAALPYGGSYFRDKKSGYMKNICIKCSRQMFFLAKSIAVFTSAAVAIMIPLFLDLYICLGLYPMREAEKQLADSVLVVYTSIFSEVYVRNSILFIVCYILLEGILAGALALISICVTDYMKTFFSIVSFPFLVSMLSSMIFSEEKKGNWSILIMLNPTQGVGIPKVYFMYMIIVIIGTASIIINNKSNGRDIL